MRNTIEIQNVYPCLSVCQGLLCLSLVEELYENAQPIVHTISELGQLHLYNEICQGYQVCIQKLSILRENISDPKGTERVYHCPALSILLLVRVIQYSDFSLA